MICSTNTSNCTGHKKLKALREHFQGREFEYIGDSAADLPIWSHLGRAHVRGASKSLSAELARQGIQSFPKAARANGISSFSRDSSESTSGPRTCWYLCRSSLRTSVRNRDLLLKTFLAFAAFSFVASSFYVFNDLLDARADRQHPIRQKRPIASGELALSHAAVLLLLTLASDSVWPRAFRFAFLVPVLVYLAGTATYSLYAKRVLLVDALVLAMLYTIRVIAGGVATGITISSWTLGYTSFLFLSLALMKRYSEISVRSAESRARRFRAVVTSSRTSPSSATSAFPPACYPHS